MEKKIENRLIMLKATLSLMEQNRPTWQETTPLVNAINQTSGLLEEIESIKETVSQNNSGLVIDKENQKEALIATVFELSSTLAAYASQVGDAILKQKVDYPISYFQNVRNTELGTTARSLATLLTEKLPELESYGVTAPKVDALREQTGIYETTLPNVRVTVSARKVANEKIKELTKAALKVTDEQTDRLMVMFKQSYPDFYNAYLNARKVVDYGTRYEKVGTNENPDHSNPDNPNP
jgi:hypothetical protein